MTPSSNHVDAGSGWAEAPATIAPLEASVHVWGARLDLPDPVLERLESLLSRAEVGRAGRLQRSRDRRRFIAAHGILRTVLGRYVDAEPARIRLGNGAHGKPGLAAVTASIHFNLSHSDDLLALAIADREVGIDVQCRRRTMRTEVIARRYFPDDEQATLLALGPRDRTPTFLRSWVCKEAFAKATGLGLSGMDLRSVAWRAPAGEAARLEGTTEAARRALADWSVFELPPLYGAPAAVVVAGTASPPHCFLWGPADAGA